MAAHASTLVDDHDLDNQFTLSDLTDDSLPLTLAEAQRYTAILYQCWKREHSEPNDSASYI